MAKLKATKKKSVVNMVVEGLEPKGAVLPTHSINLFGDFSNPIYNGRCTCLALKEQLVSYGFIYLSMNNIPKDAFCLELLICDSSYLSHIHKIWYI